MLIIVKISLSTTFAQTEVGKPVGLYEYTRSSNPNRLVCRGLSGRDAADTSIEIISRQPLLP